MAIEFSVYAGGMHHAFLEILASTDPADTDYHSVDLSDTVPNGTNHIAVHAHVTSTNTDDELYLAKSARPSHYHHIITTVSNKEAAQFMIVGIDPATRYLWWKVTNARVSDVVIEMYYSWR